MALKVFLSYHSPDGALAETLKHALEARHENVEVFFAPSSLRAGNFFPDQKGPPGCEKFKIALGIESNSPIHTQ